MNKRLTRATDFTLVMSGERLELRQNGPKAPGPIAVDFVKGPLDFRRRHGGAGGQLILKAVGGPGKKVLDATAGLCRDAFILASLGLHVTAVERNPMVAELLRDGLRRGRMDPKVSKILNLLEFISGDAREVMVERPHQWDVIYLDPMFPESDKSALPKKEMRILHDLLEDDANRDNENESFQLLSLALECAPRVVVKRPLKAGLLKAGVAVQFKASSTRFDVYLASGLKLPTGR